MRRSIYLLIELLIVRHFFPWKPVNVGLLRPVTLNLVERLRQVGF